MASLPITTNQPGPSQGDYSNFDLNAPLPTGDPSGLPIPSAGQDLTAGTLPVREMPAATAPEPPAFGMEVVDRVLSANGMPALSRA